MSGFRQLDQDDVVETAAAALGRTVGEAIRIRDVETLSDAERRNLILRATAVRESGHAQPIIVKVTRSAAYDATAGDAYETSGLVKEWAATAYLAKHAAGRGHGAAFLAGDARLGLLVFADLGRESDSLVGPLLDGTPEAAERALVAYATSLGRLHADTAGCKAAHAEILQAAFPDVRPAGPRPLAGLDRAAAMVQARLGGVAADAELAQVAARLREPGPWLALVHGDPCPDNALLARDEIRLIDFEFAAPGHALWDGVYWRLGFPTCWCAGRIPEAVAVRVDAAYRAALGPAIAEALDDRSSRSETAFIAVAWLLRSLEWRLDEALADDGRWGIASIRGRLLWYLEATIRMCEDADSLPGLRSTARSWLAELHSRWPATTPLDVYPAFRPRDVATGADPPPVAPVA